MTVITEKADDDVDAFDALESEEKEFIKVRIVLSKSSLTSADHFHYQDAEIDRILKAFRLDA
jgi:DnaJ family protein C protein 8